MKSSSIPSQIKHQKKDIDEMFNEISKQYDFFNRLFSFRLDVVWRRILVKNAGLRNGQKILDLATGTGDVAIEIKKRFQETSVYATDVAKNMLGIAQGKADRQNMEISFVQKDVGVLPYTEKMFDHIFISFGVRNFDKLLLEFEEINRVLKPGGKLHIIDFFQPDNSMPKYFLQFYVSIWMPWVVKLFAQNAKAYDYLSNSIKTFYKARIFREIISNCGFICVKKKKFTLGLCEILRFEK